MSERIKQTFIDFSRPASVAHCAVSSGVMTDAAYMGDKDGFVSRAIGAWQSFPQNYLPMETEKHTDFAAQLYEFYQSMHDWYLSHDSKGLGKILSVLARESLDDAWKALGEVKNRWYHKPGPGTSVPDQELHLLLEVGERIDALRDHRETLRVKSQEIESQQDRLAAQGFVKDSQAHRIYELSALRRELFEVNHALKDSENQYVHLSARRKAAQAV